MGGEIPAAWTLSALRAHRDEIVALVERYGGYNVRVFGSVARGDATAGSDVDILVSFPPDRSVFDLVGLWLDLQGLVGCEVSLISDGIDDEQFLRAIRKDAVPL